jgi:hypothetical protein
VRHNHKAEKIPGELKFIRLFIHKKASTQPILSIPSGHPVKIALKFILMGLSYPTRYLVLAYQKAFLSRANFKTSHFGQSLRWAQILILEILNVFLWLKFSPALTLTKLKRFETGSPF